MRNYIGTFLMQPAAAGKGKGRKRGLPAPQAGSLALRPGDCVPRHPC